MIIQALKEYYDRKSLSSSDDGNIPTEGFENKELPFLIVIDKDGKFLNLEDTREDKRGKSFMVPRSVKRSGKKSYETTFLLWDHVGYVLGTSKSTIQHNDQATEERAAKQNETWRKSLKELSEFLKEDEGIKAVVAFYEKNEDQKVWGTPNIKDCLSINGCNMSFRLNTDVEPVVCRQAVREYVKKVASTAVYEDGVSTDQDSRWGVCSVTGEDGEIARIHGATPIGKDAKSLIGIQRDSGYDSYGKEQGYNAPVIKSTEFAYVTALNILLKSKQRMNLGGITTVFWSEKNDKLESDFSTYFEEPAKDNPDANAKKIRELFNSVESGAFAGDKGQTKFYILGLSPNSARIAVRFWDVKTIKELASNIKEYFEDMSIVKSSKEPEFYSLWRILVNISIQDRSENIPPNMAGEFMKSILNGTPFPETVIRAAVRRIRSDTEFRVKAVRASVIKAYLNRYDRFYPNKTYKEVEMSLDKNQTSIGYLLGRLFAVFEKIQEEANPGLNATIRERFYGSASSTPVMAFPTLLKLKNHHLAKMENKGRVINFEKIIGEIMSNIEEFPTHINLHEQGLFAIGYYHQRQSFFDKSKE